MNLQHHGTDQISQRYAHPIVLTESSRTKWTFSRPGSPALFNTDIAKGVPARLQHGVFELFATDGTVRELLSEGQYCWSYA